MQIFPVTFWYSNLVIAFLFRYWKRHTISFWYLFAYFSSLNILSANGKRKPPYSYPPQPGFSMMQYRWPNYSKVKKHSTLSRESHITFPEEVRIDMINVHPIGNCSWSKWIVNKFCYLSLFCFGWSQWRQAIEMISSGSRLSLLKI